MSKAQGNQGYVMSEVVEDFQALCTTKGAALDFPEQDPEYETSEPECEEDYRVGGYHPVQIGETFNKGRYRVLQKLGWGHFSTVWLSFDFKRKQQCALKVQKADPHYAEAARDEIKLLKSLKQDGKKMEETVVELLDHFEHEGPHGRHVCLAFEVLSKSLLSLIKRFNYHGVPLPLIRLISRQILEGLDFIHETCGIIHTDLKPENVLFAQHDHEKKILREEARRAAKEIEVLRKANKGDSKLDYTAIGSVYRPNPDLAFSSGQVKLVDFGNACWVDNHFTDDIQTRQYRAPEVILGHGYDTKADVWSLACLIFELATGDFLFDPHSGEDYDRDEDHLALIMELLGPVPSHMRKNATYEKDFFDECGDLLHISKLNFWSLRDVLREKYKFPADDAEELTSFLLPMLYIDPVKRASARQQLKHPFFSHLSAKSLSQDEQQTCQSRQSVLTSLPRTEVSGPGESLHRFVMNASR